MYTKLKGETGSQWGAFKSKVNVIARFPFTCVLIAGYGGSIFCSVAMPCGNIWGSEREII